MNDSEGCDEPGQDAETVVEVHPVGMGLVELALPPLKQGVRRAEVVLELNAWLALDAGALREKLRRVIRGEEGPTVETLVHLTRRAYAAGDRTTLNLAFETLAKRATPLLLSIAKCLPRDKRQEHVQEILTTLFEAIQNDKADFAESNFAIYARRRSIENYRKRSLQFEKVNWNKPSTDILDPVDNLPDRRPSAAAWVALRSGLARMSPKQRAAFVQYHLFEMTQKEIAVHHGVDQRTIRNWLREAEDVVELTGGKK